MRRVLTATAVVASFVTTTATAQFPQASGFAVEDPVLRRIWAIETDSSQLPHLAQVLFDSLGPRLTASPGMTAAQNWLLATYAAWGITARKEQYGTWRSWRRGKTHIDLVTPRQRTLDEPGLRDFIEKNLGRELDEWPPKRWNLELLTLAAYYFQPSLDVARAQWRMPRRFQRHFPRGPVSACPRRPATVSRRPPSAA